ncbi:MULTISPECIES: hypothetical protein [Ramlibacter]|uniref:Uncharacterized protein n=1 Tax=Ramlibacter aquaticus TaxID=2780094 RepID=A0ABR9SIC3_9BURK|nr:MULTISPECIES: hypothetical protein [Ramlibacter]MBE7942116.1 hypothetical protein [Ramlibacter aquaticus]
MKPDPTPGRGRPAADPPAGSGTASPERRSAERVRDDQQSGQGAASALSKFKMQERKRATLRPRPEAD